MRFVHRDAGVERDMELRLGRQDAVVADLATSLGGYGGALMIDGRPTAPATPLTGSGLVMGSEVSLTVTPDSDPGTMSDRGFVLRVVGGLDAGLSVPLMPGRYRLGRGEQADIRVDSPDLSRLHCEIDVTRDGLVRVRDLGSRNGTDLNGQRLTGPARVGPQDTVSAAGRVPFRILPVADLGPVQYVNPAHEAGPGGTLPFNRAPRLAASAEAGPIKLPQAPKRANSQPLRVTTIVAPIILAAVMVMILKNPAFALFALFSPVMMIGTQMEDRTRGRVGLRRGKRDYAARLAEVHGELQQRREDEEDRLREDYPDPAEVLYRASVPGLRLWERRHGAPDFLRLSAGYADQAWTPPVDHSRRSGGFYPSSTDQEPDPAVADAIADASWLSQVPVAVNLADGGVLGLEGDRGAALAAARSLLCQAVAESGPADVAVAVFADDDRIADWDWTKWLPHGADPRSGSSRYVAVGAERCETLARSLLAELADAGAGPSGFGGGRSPDPAAAGMPTLLLIVDGATLLEGRPCALRDLLGGAGAPAGQAGQVAGIVLTRRLPALCTEVLSVSADGFGRLHRVASGQRVDDVLVNGMTRHRARTVARSLARFEDPEVKAAGAGLPDRVNLLPLLNLPGALDAAVAGRWRATVGTLRARAVLGVTDHGQFEIDLDDDGPHGLIAGTTGSGKSELLRTLIASLAAGADPEHLTFALVDYKGGGALDECARLPHVVGLVTDLDEQLGERALRCLEAELRHREHALRGVGLSHVRDYQRLRDAQRPDLEPMPRLVVVIDEFATLVKALPEFVDALVSIAQRGRSLGMHLVMATQRPSGSVNDAIKNNVKLRLALRLESAADSQDVIDSNAAAGIGSRQWGRGFYRVSAGEVLPVQTALSTGITPVDDAAGRLSLVPFRLTSGERAGAAAAPDRDGAAVPGQATDLARLVEAAQLANYSAGFAQPRRPWPDPLPTAIPLHELGPAAKGLQTDAPGLAAYALADDPDRQAQYTVGWDPAVGNILIYGGVNSGTTTALSALALSAASADAPDRLHLYVLDLGSGALAPLQGLPHTGAYIGPGDRPRQIRLIRMLRTELNTRKAGGSVRDPNTPGPPRVIVLIDNVGSLRSELEKDFGGLQVLDDLERVFADGPAVGLYIAATGDRLGAIPSAWGALSRQKLLLRLADATDYANFDIPRRAVPAAVPGRAVVVATRQVVQIGYPGAELGAAVSAVAQRWTGAPRTANKVRLLPEIIPIDRMRRAGVSAATGGEPWSIPIGFTDSTLAAAVLRLHEHEHALIAGPSRSGRSSALVAIAQMVLTGTQPPALVAFAPRRSPLRDLPPTVIGCTEYAELERALDSAGDRALLLVDDADTVTDTLQVIDRFMAKPGRHVIAAGRNDGVRRQFGQWTQRVRESRCGILLVPDHDHDHDLLGTPLPRQHRMAPLPGRGYLVCDGTIEGVQLVQAASGDFYNDRGSADLHRSLDDRTSRWA